MKIVEKLATKARLGPEHPPRAGPLELGRRDADDGRQIAGDERQDARREERDEPGRDGREDAYAGCGIGHSL